MVQSFEKWLKEVAEHGKEKGVKVVSQDTQKVWLEYFNNGVDAETAAREFIEIVGLRSFERYEKN